MSGLVDDLFALSPIHAGALRLTVEQVAPADVVSDAVAGTTPITAAKGVRLVAEQTRYPTIRALAWPSVAVSPW